MVTKAKEQTQEQAIRAMIEKEGYSIKGLKTFFGMEHMGGFNCNLYRQGKKVAYAYNDDTGGETGLHWESREEREWLEGICTVLPEKVYNTGRMLDVVHNFGTPDEKEEQFDLGEDMIHRFKCTPEDIVDHLVEEEKLKKDCKNHTIVILHSSDEGHYLEYSGKYTERIVKQIEEEHGDDLKEIVNARWYTPISDKDADNEFWKKKCRTGIVIITDQCKDGQFIHWKVPYTPENVEKARDQLKKKNQKVVEVVNERFK